METDNYQAIVVGAGFGGLVAAATAAERGMRVAVLEAGPRVGGTVALSSGLMHMYDAPSWEAYKKAFPTVDQELGRVLYDRFPEFVGWLRDVVNVPMASSPLPADPYGDPGRVPQGYLLGLSPPLLDLQPVLKPLSAAAYWVLGDSYLRLLDRAILRSIRAQVVERLWAIAEAHGTQLILQARVESVSRTRGGYEVSATTPEGEVRLNASKVLFASGGFQGNPTLLSQHMGHGGVNAQCRAARTNLGDGLRIAQKLGASVKGPMDRFYGYPMPVLPAPIDHESDPIALLSCTAYYAGNSVMVTRTGERFVDEPAAAKVAGLSHAIATKTDGECWAILDSALRKRFGTKEFGGGLLPPMKLIDSAAARGAVVAEGNTLDELAQKLGEQGVDAARLSATLAQYNDAAGKGTSSQLSPPRTASALPLLSPPFYAIRLAAGVSMTYGGLHIDEQARVVGTDGAPLVGLYAVPGVAGGLYTHQYGGALAACGTFGRVAGRSMARAEP
jgi:predicted oxidoreductase